MSLSNDVAHCEGVILERHNTHLCDRRTSCYRYTEAMRKRQLAEDGIITFTSATDRCDIYHELPRI
jgi:hypothetical protein